MPESEFFFVGRQLNKRGKRASRQINEIIHQIGAEGGTPSCRK